MGKIPVMEVFGPEVVSRFMSKVDKTETCWNFTGGISTTGYGNFWFNNKSNGAHKIAYLMFNGEVEEGMVVRHTCDNKKCVNPDHLILGTVSDNAKDAVERGRWARQHGQYNGIAKFTYAQVEAIREEYNKGGWTYQALADKYKVALSVMWELINRKSYAKGVGAV